MTKPRLRTRTIVLLAVLGLMGLIVACGGTPTPTLTPPTATPAPPTATKAPIPPTAAPVPPTAAPAPPTATSALAAPTATSAPPTATRPPAPTAAPVLSTDSTSCVACHTDKATLEKLATKKDVKSEQTSGEG
jgi:mono/diheme cytochrome c family protein